jgi:glycosyltransferase involved in cell wall biosynthesis
VRLEHDLGAAGGRNVGISLARGAFIAFTDSDCTPSAGWLRAAMRAFDDQQVGIVQGRTIPARPQAPLFEHHIETGRMDGHFSTSNVVYRREAIKRLRFDPAGGCGGAAGRQPLPRTPWWRTR